MDHTVNDQLREGTFVRTNRHKEDGDAKRWTHTQCAQNGHNSVIQLLQERGVLELFRGLGIVEAVIFARGRILRSDCSNPDLPFSLSDQPPCPPIEHRSEIAFVRAIEGWDLRERLIKPSEETASYFQRRLRSRPFQNLF